MITSGSISVIIPAYNHEAYVGAAVASVAAQSLAPLEVVVVDDGSTDCTREIVEALTISGLSIHSQENRGAHHALNRAAAISHGEYLAILNSDDVFRANWLEQALGVARATGAGLVMGQVDLLDADGLPLPNEHATARWYEEALQAHARAPSLRQAVVRHNFAMTTSNFFVHRALWEELGGFRDYRYVHDLDFLLRALALCPNQVVFEDSLLGVGYRVHGANTINEDVEAALAERSRLLADSTRWQVRGAAWVKGPGARKRLASATRRSTARLSFPPKTEGDQNLTCGLVVPSLDAGGLEEVVALLAQGLPACGIDAPVLCTHGGGAVARRLREAGLHVTVANGDPNAWTTWLRRERPDVVSTHFVSLDVVERLHEGGSKIVETVHNTYAWFKAEHWVAERAKATILNGVVAVSDTVADYYGRHVPGTVDCVAVIPNAVHPERLAVVPRTFARRQLGFDPEEKVLVQLGRISRQKNQAGLVTAFAQIAEGNPRARLVLAGAIGDATVAQRIRKDHATLLASGRLLMPGPSDSPNLLLSAADAYVSFALFEGWSVAASEALWAGLPLMLSDCGGSRELVGGRGERGSLLPHPLGDPMAVDPETILMPPEPEAIDDLAVALKALIDSIPDGGTRERAAWARSHLKAETMCAEYARTFRQAVAKQEA